MTQKPRVLIVEDEPAIRQGLRDLLAYHAMEPTLAATGTEGLELALSCPWDLILLDVMLPGVDGFTVCARVREARPGQAILILTAKGREEDILEGFRAGCDDYVPKPFSIALLVARAQALIRRSTGARPRVFDAGSVVVDADALVARRGGHSIDLSPRDVAVLEYLDSCRDRVVSREDLLRTVWGYQRVEAVETRCVDMHIVKLRRKLAAVAGDEPVVLTVRGAGYRLATSDSE